MEPVVREIIVTYHPDQENRICLGKRFQFCDGVAQLAGALGHLDFFEVCVAL